MEMIEEAKVSLLAGSFAAVKPSARMLAKKLIAALETAEAEKAELRKRVAELEGIVRDCLDCSPTHRELVKRAAAAMAKGGV